MSVFMRKHGIVLNFELDQIRHRKQVLPVLHEGTDQYLQVRRQAMRYKDASQTKEMLGKEQGTSKDGLQ